MALSCISNHHYFKTPHVLTAIASQKTGQREGVTEGCCQSFARHTEDTMVSYTGQPFFPKFLRLLFCCCFCADYEPPIVFFFFKLS